MTHPLQIVIPMAGIGSRFADAGYDTPKPLIEVGGRPMIQLVVANLRPSRPHRYVFIAQQAHEDDYQISKSLQQFAPGCEVVLLDGVTQGAACTVLTARPHLDLEAPLMIANSDQWVDIDIDDYLAAHDANGCAGWVMTMYASDPKWSYVRLDDEGCFSGIAEKDPVSDHATVGVYNFSRARYFFDAAERMIAEGLRVNGEFFVAPVFDHLVAAGRGFGVYNVGSEANGMYGLGVPADLELFCGLPVRDKALSACDNPPND